MAEPRHDDPLTIRDFQRRIYDRYYLTDSARGPARTFLWFVEEVGELASAMGELDRDGSDDDASASAGVNSGSGDRQNLKEEFADVFAWLCTLANILDVDLAAAVAEKYPADGGPTGTKS